MPSAGSVRSAPQRHASVESLRRDCAAYMLVALVPTAMPPHLTAEEFGISRVMTDGLIFRTVIVPELKIETVSFRCRPSNREARRLVNPLFGISIGGRGKLLPRPSRNCAPGPESTAAATRIENPAPIRTIQHRVCKSNCVSVDDIYHPMCDSRRRARVDLTTSCPGVAPCSLSSIESRIAPMHGLDPSPPSGSARTTITLMA